MKQADVRIGAVVGYNAGRYRSWGAFKAKIIFIGTDYVRVEYDELQFTDRAMPGESKMVVEEVSPRKLIHPWVPDPDRDERLLKARKKRQKDAAKVETINRNLAPLGIVIEGPEVGRRFTPPSSITIPIDQAVKLARRVGK